MKMRKLLTILCILILVGGGIFLAYQGVKFYVLPKYTIEQGTKELKSVKNDEIQKNIKKAQSHSKIYDELMAKHKEELDKAREKAKLYAKKHGGVLDPKLDVNDNGIIDADEERILGIRIPGAIHYKGAIKKNSELSGSGYDPFITYDQSNVRSIRTIPLDARVNRNYMVGQLYVPAVGMRIAVMEGVNNMNLNLASGTMKPGQRMGYGNYAIAGHHMQDPRLLFTPLMNAQKGNMVYLSDGRKVYEYKINSIRVVSPSHVEIDDDIPGRKMVTLMLCEDLNSINRRIIQGDLVKVSNINRVSKELKENLTGY